MDRDDYARWLQLKLHQTFTAPAEEEAPDALLALALRAEAAIKERARPRSRRRPGHDDRATGSAA